MDALYKQLSTIIAKEVENDEFPMAENFSQLLSAFAAASGRLLAATSIAQNVDVLKGIDIFTRNVRTIACDTHVRVEGDLGGPENVEIISAIMKEAERAKAANRK